MKHNQQRRFLPSLAVLRSFECSARHESFTLAAEELNLTQSAISRQVRELEEAIGTSLFRRVGRRVVLTDSGKNLANELAIDLERIRQTVFRAIATGQEGVNLRIAILPTFANRWLIPRLKDFEKKHPDIEISLTTRLQPFNFTHEKLDLAIHYGSDDWPNTDMIKMFKEEMVVVASPDFCKEYPIKEPGDLQDIPLIHLETRPLAWSDWFEQMGISERQVYPGKQFDQFSMIIRASIASLGAALIPQYLIEQELKSKTLIKLHKHPLTSNNSYFLVKPINSSSPQLNAFSDWMLSEVNK